MAQEGDEFLGTVTNYLGTETLAASGPADAGGLGWVVVVAVDPRGLVRGDRAPGDEAVGPTAVVLRTHHAGHGLGLGHPESPIIVSDSTDVLLAGDIVTLEPGSYVEGIGGMRIEHNYLITEDGYERLSNHEIRLT